MFLQQFGLPENYKNDALIFIKESSVQQVEKVLKARQIMGVERMSTKFEKIATCIAGTHIGDEVSSACVSRNHPFPDLHYRVLNQLRGVFRRNPRFVPPANYSILSDPFPEGSDPTENSAYCSYFVRLDTEAPIAAGRVHPLGISLCMSYAHRGGTTFFDDRMGPFPALEALSNESLVAYRDACMRHDPMDTEEKPRIVFLEERLNSFFSDVIPEFDDHFATEEVQFEVPNVADIDCVVEEVVSPFTLLLSQRNAPDHETIAVALLVGPVSLYLFRLWNPDGSNTDGTESVYALFRPKRIHYFSGGCPASAYTMTVCNHLDALHGFLRRILDLPPAGSNLSRAVAPTGRVMARFYIGNKPTLCVSTDANYGLSTEVIAGSNAAWQSNQQATGTSQTEESEDQQEQDGDAGTQEQHDNVTLHHQPPHEEHNATMDSNAREQSNATDFPENRRGGRPAVSEQLMAGFVRRQQTNEEQFSEQREQQQREQGQQLSLVDGTGTTDAHAAQSRQPMESNDLVFTNNGDPDTSSTSSGSYVHRAPIDRRAGWLSRLRRDSLLNSDSSDSDTSERNNNIGTPQSDNMTETAARLRRDSLLNSDSSNSSGSDTSDRNNNTVTSQRNNMTETAAAPNRERSPDGSTHVPLPSIVHGHPHRSFFEQHHSGTDGSWASYTVVPFFIDGVGTDLGNDDEDEEEREIARVTGECVAQTGSTCPFCLRSILETDDIAFSNRCPHIMHESCCRHWFQRVGFPSESSEVSTGGDALTELLPMGRCPECRVVGRWRCKHNDEWMPDGHPVYGIHQLFDATTRPYRRRRRGDDGVNLVPVRSQLSLVVHIHSSILYSAIKIARGYISSVTEIAREDMHVLTLSDAKLLHKLYLWSLFPSIFPCHRCQKKRPWASLYKWSNCDNWCHAVLCMDCSAVSRNGLCSVCGKSGFLKDYNGSPFSRNTRQQRRPLHNPDA
jgi:hypothetical protein